MSKKMTAWQKAFSAGYACACANIIRTHGEDVIAKDCLKQNFFSIEDMRDIGVDELDIIVLTPIIKEIQNTHTKLTK